MAIKYSTLDLNQKPTEAQLQEIEEAAKYTIVFDEDCPKLTAEDLAKFKKVINIKREERRKETVSLRLSARSLAKAKLLGKGYTTVLSKILEQAINDTDMITLATKYF